MDPNGTHFRRGRVDGLVETIGIYPPDLFIDTPIVTVFELQRAQNMYIWCKEI